LYDSNNLVSSLLYHIPTTSSQGRHWVVGYGHYHIVGDSLTHNSQDNILTPRTKGYVVKIVKNEHKVLNIFFPCSNALASFIFIELSDFSLGEDLTSDGSLMRSLKCHFVLGLPLTPK
jgi:hypothetical protein